jgi:exopolyphosphatase/guanosine-5'-triphosphate,3'-diphosphate pyrophosphatase
MNDRLAVMDLGTNTFHLMVADVVDGKPSVVFRDRRPVKLGKGGINRATIQPDAVQRALDCMRDFRRDLESLRVTRSVAVGTSALRSATNASDLLDAIQDTTGIHVEVISGDQEARYIYLGVRQALDLGTCPSLIVDIGGGSVEFIIANHREVYWQTSLDIGAQRLMELYHRHDPITPDECSALEAHYDHVLVPVSRAIDEWKPEILVGSSGTFDTLSEIYCTRAGIAYAATDPETPLTVAEFWEIHRDLLGKDRKARMRIPGMIEMRVDMIVVASALIARVLARFAFKKIRVSSYSLKEGVMASLISGE